MEKPHLSTTSSSKKPAFHPQITKSTSVKNLYPSLCPFSCGPLNTWSITSNVASPSLFSPFPICPPTPPFYFSKYMHTFDPGCREATERGNNAGLSGWQKYRARKRATGRWCVGARSIFTARLEVSRFGASYTLHPAMWVYLVTSRSVHHLKKSRIRESKLHDIWKINYCIWLLGSLYMDDLRFCSTDLNSNIRN